MAEIASRVDETVALLTRISNQNIRFDDMVAKHGGNLVKLLKQDYDRCFPENTEDDIRDAFIAKLTALYMEDELSRVEMTRRCQQQQIQINQLCETIVSLQVAPPQMARAPKHISPKKKKTAEPVVVHEYHTRLSKKYRD